METCPQLLGPEFIQGSSLGDVCVRKVTVVALFLSSSSFTGVKKGTYTLNEFFEIMRSDTKDY
jgi:hypothetical protein